MASNAKNLAEYLNNQTTSATADIADGSITTDKLAADAVTAAKLADNSVVTANISAGTLEGSGVNLGRRNLVINGAMKVAQRGTQSGQGSGNAYSAVDRFQITSSSTDGRLTSSQSTDAPAGFANSLQLVCTTADTSIAAGELTRIRHRIEGRNVQHIQKGTSGAKPITLSYHAKASTGGVIIVEVQDADNNRLSSVAHTITTSYQKFTHTFPADTTGALDNDNNNSLTVSWVLHAGSNYKSGTLGSAFVAGVDANKAVGQTFSLFGATSRQFNLSGVQLEVGSTATEFEHLPFYEELVLCSRYYRAIGRLMMGYREGYSTASITLHPGMRRVGSDATNIVTTIGSSGVMYSRAAVNNSTGTLNGTVGHSSSSNDQSLQVSFSHNGASTGSLYNGTVGALYVDSVTLDSEL